jgi:hypothetical protein
MALINLIKFHKSNATSWIKVQSVKIIQRHALLFFMHMKQQLLIYSVQFIFNDYFIIPA